MSSTTSIGATETAVAVPLAVPGLFGWEKSFEGVLYRVGARISALGAEEKARFLRLPPLISRATIDRVRYREAFPHLLGEVAVWDGASEADPMYAASAMVLTPAACYHVYPLAGAQDTRGETFEIESWCFRNESADDTSRLSAFRMREFVKIGDPEVVYRWREAWTERALRFVRSLGVEAKVAAASDPFFGTRGQLLATRQQAKKAKYEVLVPMAGGDDVAVASANYHNSHFGDLFDLRSPSGDPAHTACVAFGLERLTSALVLAHGPDFAAWPREVQHVLDGLVS